MKKIRVQVKISGRVQGVGFRYSTLQHAQKLGLSGWVKNTFDGNVEAVFEGDEYKVEEMLLWCKKGPTMAYVQNLEVYKLTYEGSFDGFIIKR